MASKHALLIGISRYPNLPASKQLKGCAADARLLAQVLEDHYGFSRDAILLLCDEQATRIGIEQAMGELLERVRQDETVVISFSGHGSRFTWRDEAGRDTYGECIVPSDSGRGIHPKLDIPDKEIHDWLLKLSQKTRHVCLIIDSCFSGGAVRDAFAASIRWLEADEDPGGWRSGGVERPGNWIPANERCTLFAACRSSESACEFELPKSPGIFHGALTYHLCQQLTMAQPGTTYLDLFERIEPQVAAHFPRQHPKLEGARHRELFGVREIRPMRFVPVRERENRSLLLGGGAAHGLAAGSEWGIYPPGTRSTEDRSRRLGKARVTEVGSLTSRAEIVEERAGIEPGARAFLESVPDGWQMAVELDSIPDPEWREWLSARIRQGSKLRLARPGEPGEVRVYLLGPREEARPGDPVPQLGALAERTWAVVARDGSLRMPKVPATSHDSIGRLVRNLETWAHYCHVLQIENRRPDEIRGQIEVLLQRETPRGWAPAAPEGLASTAVFEEGEPVAVEVRNRSTNQPVYVYVLDLGLTGRVELLYPVPGADEPLAPGGVLKIGTLEEEKMELTLPGEFPFEPSRNGTVEGREYLKVFALAEQGDLTPLLQEGFRLFEHSWTTETRSFLVRRKGASA